MALGLLIVSLSAGSVPSVAWLEYWMSILVGILNKLGGIAHLYLHDVRSAGLSVCCSICWWSVLYEGLGLRA